MLENIVLLKFQGVTGCRSPAVKDNDGESAFGEGLNCSPMITCCFPSWFGAEVMWRGKSVLRMLKDSAEEGFSKATACGLQPPWETAQPVIARALKHHFFRGFSDVRARNRELSSNRLSKVFNDGK